MPATKELLFERKWNLLVQITRHAKALQTLGKRPDAQMEKLRDEMRQTNAMLLDLSVSLEDWDEWIANRNIEENIREMEQQFMEQCAVYHAHLDAHGEPPGCVYEGKCGRLCVDFTPWKKE